MCDPCKNNFSVGGNENRAAVEILRKEIDCVNREKILTDKLLSEVQYTNELQKALLKQLEDKVAALENTKHMKYSEAVKSTAHIPVKKRENTPVLLIQSKNDRTSNDDVMKDVVESINPADLNVCISATRKKTMFVIEFSAPAEVNIVSKEEEKRTKYQELLGQLRRLWPDYAVSLLVMVIGSLGGMRNTLLSALCVMPVCRAAAHILAARMQKAERTHNAFKAAWDNTPDYSFAKEPLSYPNEEVAKCYLSMPRQNLHNENGTPTGRC
nr:unnamed protein product [Callosobruchus chinensis]